MNDSLGNPDPQPYSIAKWDGENWNFKKLFYNFNLIIASIRGILILNSDNVYLAAGSIFHWDRVSASVQLVYSRLNLPNPNATIEKLWGNSNSSIYGVGNAGTIVFYNGQNWQEIESGTDLTIHDVNGFTNLFTGETEILCVADDPNFLEEVRVIRINENNTTEILNNTGLGIAIGSIWFLPSIRYYIVGNGLYEKTFKDTSVWIDLNSNMNITQYFMESIRGNALNDIIVAGSFGEVLHFNGLSWKSIRNSETTLSNGSYFRVAVKGNTVAAVGYDGSQAVILIGHR